MIGSWKRSCSPRRPLREPDHGDGALDRGPDRVDALANGGKEVPAQQQILGRVAGDAELGQNDQLRVRVGRSLDPAPRKLDVALDVAHGGVDLGERQAQMCRLCHIPSM